MSISCIAKGQQQSEFLWVFAYDLAVHSSIQDLDLIFISEEKQGDPLVNLLPKGGSSFKYSLRDT